MEGGDHARSEPRTQHGSAVLLLALLVSLALSAGLAAADVSAANDSWTSTTSYPTSTEGLSCVTSGGYVYCLGDGTDAVYYAPLTSSGVGAWSATASYPTDISGQSCAAYGGYLYCVSGINGTLGPRPTPAVYFAPLSASGGVTGAWNPTTDYPISSIALSCAVSSGYIYCVGGEETVGTLQTDGVYYAPVSSTGVGAWSSTTAYPQTVDAESCVASGGFLYCIAGYTALGPQPINSTYFAPISSSGVGSWASGADYPTATFGQSCLTAGENVYCVGGGSGTDGVYYSSLSSGGIGAWTSGQSYPVGVAETSCVNPGTTVYCVAGGTSEGDTDAVYYASTSTSSTSTTASSTTTTTSTSTDPTTTTPTTTTSDGSGIALTGTQSTSGTVSSSPYQITLANFNVGTGSDRLLVVGVAANDNHVRSITFGGVRLTRAVDSFYNNDAEFWSLTNPTGVGDIVVTMAGSTSVVVGAYSLSGVSQTDPIPVTAANDNRASSSPKISITTKYSDSWVLDLPSIYGGATLSRPTCSQQWDVNIPNAIAGASSSKVVSSPGAATCSWTASARESWDDVAIEVNPSTPSSTTTSTTSFSHIGETTRTLPTPS